MSTVAPAAVAPVTSAAGSRTVSGNGNGNGNGNSNGNGNGNGNGETRRRVRTSKPKVKTGCSNCKQRRIKCDELRPECSQCVRSKKFCTGYPPPARSARPHEVISIAPRPISNAPSAPPPIAATSATPLPLIAHRPVTAITAIPHQSAFSVIRQPRDLPPRNRRAQKFKVRMMPDSVGKAPPLFHGLPRVLRFNPGEEQYFAIFQARTSGELSGYFDCVFWTQTVLRECESSATIKHAVLALGALYKTLEQTSQSPPNSPDSNTGTGNTKNDAGVHWEAAIKLYSDAIHSQKNDPNESITPRVRLMLSVLLASFDSFVGDHKQAIQQIQVGLAFLDKLREEKQRAFSYQGEEPVEEELLQMFTRLAIQAKSYDMAFHFPEPFVVRLIQRDSAVSSPQSVDSPPGTGPQMPQPHALPLKFSSALEARIMYDKLLETIFRFTETFFTMQKAQGAAPMGLLPKQILTFGAAFKNQLAAWDRAYVHILESRFAPIVSWQEKTSIAVLKMTHLMTTILFLMTFNKTECAFDQYEADFDHIVQLATEVVGDEERRAVASCSNPGFCPHRRFDRQGTYTACHIKPSFSADLGIVPPLYVVATKCRSPWIRRRAIDLLQSSARREGMWDSQLAARIGECIMNLEEDDGSGGPRVTEVLDMQQQQQQQQQQQHQVPISMPISSPSPTVSTPVFTTSSVPPWSPSQPDMSQLTGVPMTPPGYISTGSSPMGIHAIPSMVGVAPMVLPTMELPIHSLSQMRGGGQIPMVPTSSISQVPVSLSMSSSPILPMSSPGIPLENPSGYMIVPMNGHSVNGQPTHTCPPPPQKEANLAHPLTLAIPENRRFMVQSVKFDLRDREADLELGTRGKMPGSRDDKFRSWKIYW